MRPGRKVDSALCPALPPPATVTFAPMTVFSFRSRPGLPVVAALTLLLAGCSVFDRKPQPPCPRVSVLGEASTMTNFRAGPGRDITDVTMNASIDSFKGTCHYDFDKKLMTMQIGVGMTISRGPAARGRSDHFSYFVAIPAFFPKPQAKSVFDVAVKFPEGVNTLRYRDDGVEITIPIPNLDYLERYEVYLGFQLNPDQLAYNRSHRASR